MSDEAVIRKYQVGQIFTPAAPINEKDLFAGRSVQIKAVLDTINQRGLHAIVYGERGVGKTSLANVLAGFFKGAPKSIVAPRVACHSADTFHDLWLRILREIRVPDSGPPIGLVPGTPNGPNGRTLADEYGVHEVTPDVVVDALQSVADQYLLILIVDEFDQLSDPRDSKLFADTIKALSDKAVMATIVLVGVADTVDELIESHESIERNLVQVPIPRMSTTELKQLITDRLPKVKMAVEEGALNKICCLSRGLPHYAHLLGLHAAWAAIDLDAWNITTYHIGIALGNAVKNCQQSIQNAYHKATVSPRKDSLFAEVLLACALAPCDDYGYFPAADVRTPLSRIMKENYDIPRFARHLTSFVQESRGCVLQEIGERYQRRFRFRNPLMQPYVILRGASSGLVTLEEIESYIGVAGPPA